MFINIKTLLVPIKYHRDLFKKVMTANLVLYYNMKKMRKRLNNLVQLDGNFYLTYINVLIILKCKT